MILCVVGAWYLIVLSQYKDTSSILYIHNACNKTGKDRLNAVQCTQVTAVFLPPG